MNNTVDPDSSATSVPTARWRRWGRRLLVTGLWGFVSLLLLFALAWQWMNWSGTRRLAAAKAQLEAAGETLDIRDLFQSLPDPPPDELNFCAVPALKDLALSVKDDDNSSGFGRKHERLLQLALPWEIAGRHRPALPEIGQALDADVWLEWLGIEPDPNETTAARLLRALEKDTELEEELAAALDRPLAQWTPAWKEREFSELPWEFDLRYYTAAWVACQYWSLRSVTAMQAGDVATAHRCARIVLRMAEAMSQEPLLLSWLYATTFSGDITNAVWEICKEQAGSVEDFARLETNLARLDYRRSSLTAYRTEMCIADRVIEWIKINGGEHLRIINSKLPLGYQWYHRAPAGWLDANSASVIEFFFNNCIIPLRDENQTFDQCGIQFERGLEKLSDRPWSSDAITLLWNPALTSNRKVLYRRKTVYSKSRVDMALLACALERHALQHGEYPESLDALHFSGGQPAPTDPISGTAYRYQRTDNGRYRLWSLGQDGKDDNGQSNLNPPISKPTHHWYLGDWVWEYP